MRSLDNIHPELDAANAVFRNAFEFIRLEKYL